MMNLAKSILRSGLRSGRRSSRRSGSTAGSGFTMLELMVVIAVILVLVAMAAGSYQRSLVRSREAVLKQDLATMRNAIQQYTLDKEMGPSSLDDLVSAGYMREVPTDPITRERIWHTNFEDVLL